MKNIITLLVIILAANFSLFSCAPMVVGGAGAGGYKAATDERSIGTMYDDTVIASKVKTRLISDEFVDSKHIDVDVLSGVVYLIGVVKSSSQKRIAANIAMGTEGVRQVKNQLVIGSTSTGKILDDMILTSKIKAELIKTKNVRANNVDVDSNNGVVTLTGIVRSESEKNKILRVTRIVAGNRKIVDNISVSR